MVYMFLFLFELFALYLLSRKIYKRLSSILLRVTKNKKLAIYTFSLFFLPGTFVHELSHFLTALILLVPVGKFDLKPRVEDKKVKLGSVSIAKAGVLRQAVIGISPFIYGVVMLLSVADYLITYHFRLGWLVLIFILFFIFQIANSMFLSRSDLKAAIRLVLLITGIYFIFSLVGLHIAIKELVFSGRVTELLKTSNILLLVPIGVDVFAYIIVSFLASRYN